MDNKKQNIIYVSLSVLLSSFLFFILYGELLNPFYDAWLLSGGPDIVQSYVGWIMYRVSDWSYPIGLITNYGFPYGVAITYTDSIPLFAIIFKILRNFLPETFQYIGLWIFTCFVLQSIFGYLLLNNFLKNKSLSFIGSIIFVLSPVMLFRLGGHFALGGHWIILYGLYLVFNKHIRIQLQWIIVLLLSLLIHPYLLFMNVFLMFSDYLTLFKNKLVNTLKLLLFFISKILFIYIMSYILGLFTISKASAPGYGDFSMNLNALFNPMGWSNVLINLDVIKYQAEGFNYLGLGVLFLLVLSFFVCIKNKCFKKFNWSIILLIIILTLLSFSNIITFSDNILFIIPLSEFIIEDILGLFRASGRFFWPVFYIIVLLSFYIIKTLRYKLALLVLIISVCLQFYDLSDKLIDRGNEFENKVFIDQLLTEEFKIASKEYNHISFIPVVPHKNYMIFSLYASKNNLTLNNGFFARQTKKLDKYIEKQINDIENGILDKDTIYVFSRDADKYTSNININNHLYILIDNTFVLFPYYNK